MNFFPASAPERGPVRSTCPYCGVGCGVLASATATIGDPDHPANFGRLCSKGSALHETLDTATRLLHPRVDGRRATWDQALDRVAGAFADTIATHGPEAVALYVSGQLLTEDYYAANKLAKGFLGTGTIDSNSRLCMSSAVAGHVRAFGEDLVPVSYEDLVSADLVVLVGSNAAWCHPVLYRRMREAEIPIVVIDPRRTASAEGAALHLPLRPGSDVALFNGLLAHLADGGASACDLPGAADALEAARLDAPDLETVAAACGLDPDLVARFYALFAATPRVVTLFSQGVNQSSSGTDKVNAIVNVHLLTGRIGPGAGPFSITGQPNAMGGREVGALANLLAGHLDWDRPADVDAVRAFWTAPRMASGPGRKAVDLFEAVGHGEIRAVWIMGTNPAVSMPDADRVRAALAACPFVAVSDCADGTDTLGFAHVALPALAWGERDGTVTNSERRISRQRPFLPPAGEARADWRIVAGVAERLGHGAAFAWSGPHEVFDEHARLTGLDTGWPRRFDISGLAGMDRAAYDAMAPVRWPVPARPAPALDLAREAPTPQGRPRLVAVRARPPANTSRGEMAFALNTGRIRDQWHTMTRTGLSPRLARHIPEPFLSIHPDDADNLADGELARVETDHGAATLRVVLDPGLRRGALFAPMHWTDATARGARINGAVGPARDPVSGQPELKHTPARIAPAAIDWHGAVLVRASLPGGAQILDALPGVAWRATWPLEGSVVRHELAGAGDAREAFACLDAWLRDACPAAEWIRLRDGTAGTFRTVGTMDDRPAALLAVGSTRAALPDRDWLGAQFLETASSSGDRRALLAGRPPGGASGYDPAICVCNDVGRGAIVAAIAAGAADVAAIGLATKAGTSCGSCRPELAALLTAR